MKQLAKYLAVGSLILAALYWIPVNLALNLPAARDALNKVQPDQWHLDWRAAWSLVPMRVALRGVAADGQTPQAHWQLDARRVAASLSLVALLRGEIRISDVDLVDVEVRLRSLRQPNVPTVGDEAAATSALPSIRNRVPDATARPEPTPREGTNALRLAVADLRLAGRHGFWINQFRGKIDGTLGGSFALDMVSGEVELTDGSADLLLRSLTIAGVPDPTGDARLKGRVEVPKTALVELTDPKALRRIDVGGELDTPVHDLAFVELFTGGLGALELTGKGRLTGRIVNRDARLQPGTLFSVDAAGLALSWPPYRFLGDGEVRLGLDASQAGDDRIAIDVAFAQVEGQFLRESGANDDDADPAAWPLFQGQGLAVELRQRLGSQNDDPDALIVPNVRVTIPEVTVPDLRVYNTLLPPQWGLDLRGGLAASRSRPRSTSRPCRSCWTCAPRAPRSRLPTTEGAATCRSGSRRRPSDVPPRRSI